jgi:Polyketide cyclase / dehydrase and lipid transport
MISILHRLCALILGSSLAIPLALAQAPLRTDTQNGSDILVNVKKNGELIIVDVEMVVQASPLATWDVLTDYDHMAQFVANVQSSKITNRKGNTLVVAQKSGTAFGLLKFSFDNVREVELVPHSEIRSNLISGDMKASAFTTRIMNDGRGVTRVLNHGEFVPTMWVPPVIGTAFLESETRRQFHELRNEIMRRTMAAKAAIPAIPRPARARRRYKPSQAIAFCSSSREGSTNPL